MTLYRWVNASKSNSIADTLELHLSCTNPSIYCSSLRWHHNGRDSISNHQPHDCLPFIQTQIKENIKAPCHWPLCGNSPGTGEFPVQMASNAENVSIWLRHHVKQVPGSTDHPCVEAWAMTGIVARLSFAEKITRYKRCPSWEIMLNTKI